MPSTVVDLFAGVGGLSDGFRQAGVSIMGALEWDSDLAACLGERHRRMGCDVPVVVQDARETDPQWLMRRLGLQEGELTYLVGGPPCQGYSHMGKRADDDKRNELLFRFVDFLSEFKAEAFVIENVFGLTTHDGGATLRSLMERLCSIGYQDSRFELLDASSFGLPQRRLRVIVHGTRTGKASNIDWQRAQSVASRNTVWDAIGDLPDPERTALVSETGSWIPYATAPLSEYAKSLRGGRRKFNRWEPVVHSERIRFAYDALAQGETDPATRCYRLIADSQAHTLRAGSRTRTACRPVHPYQPRVVTIREAARLQSLSDDYPLPRRISMAHVGIGNSGPPVMAREIARVLESALDS